LDVGILWAHLTLMLFPIAVTSLEAICTACLPWCLG